MSQQLLAVTAPQTSYTQREGYVFDKKISTSMRGLKELFSDPTLATRASFRCSTEGPSDIDILFESIFPEGSLTKGVLYHLRSRRRRAALWPRRSPRPAYKKSARKKPERFPAVSQ